MKYNIWFTLKGPAGTLEMPNSTNPIESQDLETVLEVLSENLPTKSSTLGLETVGVRIEKVEE